MKTAYDLCKPIHPKDDRPSYCFNLEKEKVAQYLFELSQSIMRQDIASDSIKITTESVIEDFTKTTLQFTFYDKRMPTEKETKFAKDEKTSFDKRLVEAKDLPKEFAQLHAEVKLPIQPIDDSVMESIKFASKVQ